ncbi:PEGA domain-containing protein [Methanosarcina mazei]|jgi:beta propeller repeat protein|uniref:PEGA domain-containing protein n=7 Tax=Methanosarcina mazei TaxID=2209 RepID=A0A0F8SHL5_METMZ|nr:PEGA domain-containing protein [Methanosarcina mazei]AAM32438.1 hypothetical protein MM_2742 [Methanosarcina mazei Go1]AKB61849.1 cell surface protein [Methanosarcina mazei SarPi]AKB65165.1 cell surface protein [Methanosarcina mazei S-6]AKB68535.1 cell surface protein [Methanosarcina mazei LYC]KKG01063.1 hypothetical protein DU47_16400 [Methanosarcina mazei]
MLINRTIILLAAAIFLIFDVYDLASAGGTTTENNSNVDFQQTQPKDSQSPIAEILSINNNSSQIASRCSPAIYGDRVVWEIIRNEGSNNDIYMYNVSTSKETQITTSGKANYPAIYEDKVVWTDYRNENNHIYMYNLSAERETQITTNESIKSGPEIYGDRIIWIDDRNGKQDIYVYNISTTKETQITTNGSASEYGSPAIYGDRIVWQDERDGNSDIYMYNLSTEKETRITINESSQEDPAIYGNRIVWTDYRNSKESSTFYMNSNSDIYMYDLSTSTETQITSNKSNQFRPEIYGDRIVWVDERNSDKSGEFYMNSNSDIYMYDLSTSTEIQITTNELDQDFPFLYSDRIVWMDSRNLSDIYMYNITNSKEIPITTNQSSQISEINVDISMSWNPDSAVPLDNATFAISGPDETYIGNGSDWTKFNASAGTYMINYEPVNGYETPVFETKNLTAGNKITFSGNYSLKKRSADSIDFGDGYILLIKQIDPANNETLMEIKLDERTVNEMRVKKHDIVMFYKISYSVNESGKPSWLDIIIEDISQDSDGNYINICITPPHLKFAIGGPNPFKKLRITSIPEGANILLDGEYIGKTPKETKITDLRTYLICLELEGYERWEQKSEVQASNKSEVQVEALLTEKQPIPTTITSPASESRYINISSIPEGAEILIDGRYIGRTPAQIPIENINEHSLCLKKEGYNDYKDDFFLSGENKKEMKYELQPIPTSLTPSKQEKITPTLTEEEGPNFLTIPALLALICGYLILRKK